MKNALIFYGGWEGHQPEKCATFFAAELRRLEFKVELVNTLDVLNDLDLLRKQDLIVPVWTRGELAEKQEKNLLKAVEEGTGIAGCHSGMADAFRNNPRYQFLVGGQYVAHVDGAKPYTVHVREGHSITHGIKAFEFKSEQYYMHVDPSNEVLATTTFDDNKVAPWVAGCVMPVVWKRHWGQGRVFYSSLGHKATDFKIRPITLLTLRGMFWAAR